MVSERIRELAEVLDDEFLFKTADYIDSLNRINSDLESIADSKSQLITLMEKRAEVLEKQIENLTAQRDFARKQRDEVIDLLNELIA